MALRLAGESYTLVNGLDSMGNLRLVDVNDASPGLRVDQRGSGRVFDFQDGGTSVLYMDDGGDLVAARDLAFSGAHDITTTSGDLTLDPAGAVVLAKAARPSSDYAMDLGTVTARYRTAYTRLVALDTSGNEARRVDGNGVGLRLGAGNGLHFHHDSALNNVILSIGGASATIRPADGKNIELGSTNGTKIGTATTQKLAFFNSTPVSQQATIADASGGATVDAEARAAVNDVLARLRTYGLIAT
jgi:hypothetical protein